MSEEEKAGIVEEEITDLHRDNASAYNAAALKQSSADKCIPVLEFPSPLHRI
jgi:hypothetical protein